MTRRTRQPQPLTASPLNSGLLQRKCDTCGQRTIAGEECPKCQQKRQTLQRQSIRQTEFSEIPTLSYKMSYLSPDFSNPKEYSPWTKVWIGKTGMVGEVLQEGVKVRIFKKWENIKIKPEDYVCGNEALQSSPDAAKKTKKVTDELQLTADKMRKVAQKVAQTNTRIPLEQKQVKLVIISEPSWSCFLSEEGLIILNEKDFNRPTFEDTVAHEGAHSIFKYHMLGGFKSQSIPDPLALAIAQLYMNLQKTKKVPEPEGKFDKKNPPSLKAKRSSKTYPAGCVMVADTLWSGEGGHPWDDAKDFFASAYAGYLQNSTLFKEIVEFYRKNTGIEENLVEELFTLLEMVGKEESEIEKLPKPSREYKELQEAFHELRNIPIPYSGNPELIKPEDMPMPEKISCPPSKPKSKEEIKPKPKEEILNFE
jgi:hypothetical protein